jgi:S-methylmethionine-dependent homocysteine/selenocysteine methylase
MKRLLQTNSLVLMEAAVVERLRRDGSNWLHPTLVNAPLVLHDPGRQALEAIYQEYVDVARAASLPLFLCTPTWRANRERVSEAGITTAINSEAVAFMRGFRDAQGKMKDSIRVGGLMGCRNDCYRPEEALSAGDAEEFHAWQIGQLSGAGVDFLLASTLPAVGEAIGIAKAMSAAQLPYIISFVINRDGCVLDGTPLAEAINALDASAPVRPIGFMVNCSYPSFLNAADQPAAVFERLIGFQANASSLEHCHLDGQSEIQVDDVADWAREMLALNQDYGVKILGGCCGTGTEHLECLVALRGEAQAR